MSNTINICPRLLLIFLLSTTLFRATAQHEAKSSLTIAELLNSKKFVFNAQSATPTGGRVIQLTSSYGFKLSNDSLKADLPYFGRAFSAPISPTESPLRFTSTEFTYLVQPRRKERWDVSIKPNDAREVRQMTLNVSSSGYGTLQVISNNRQAISFYGTVTPVN